MSNLKTIKISLKSLKYDWTLKNTYTMNNSDKNVKKFSKNNQPVSNIVKNQSLIHRSNRSNTEFFPRHSLIRQISSQIAEIFSKIWINTKLEQSEARGKIKIELTNWFTGLNNDSHVNVATRITCLRRCEKGLWSIQSTGSKDVKKNSPSQIIGTYYYQGYRRDTVLDTWPPLKWIKLHFKHSVEISIVSIFLKKSPTLRFADELVNVNVILITDIYINVYEEKLLTHLSV